jgi:hypothetical protein
VPQIIDNTGQISWLGVGTISATGSSMRRKLLDRSLDRLSIVIMVIVTTVATSPALQRSPARSTATRRLR